MLDITNFRQGAVLNHLHGRETDKGLTVQIEGISEYGRPVKVNGVPAEMEGRIFRAEVELTQKFNDVTASVLTPFGTYSQTVTLVWDKKSFRRCNFYIDDHSFLFTDLAKERPQRAFDHFYLKGLKAIHDKLGFKVTLNCFFHNDHHEFVLSDMPDIWKSEFIDNSDWLKLSFHAYSEFPDRPYLEASAEEFGRDYDQVKNEIIRFAGEETWIPPFVIHWANINPAVANELIKRGTRCYSRKFRPSVMGGPSLADRQKGGDMNKIQSISCKGADGVATNEGLDMHFSINEEYDYIKRHNCYYDPTLGVFFLCSCCTCNLTPIEEIKKRFAKQKENAEKYKFEVFCAASHEQYTFPYYPNYIPDHLQRIECATRCLVEDLGCKPVFANDGIMGNTAWE